ncbi:MAG: AIM24 family protein [Cellulosilyticaceae bacterium]
MSVDIKNLETSNRVITQQKGNFSVLEHKKDLSVSYNNAANEYYMSKMGVCRKQVVIELDDNSSATVQAGAMQWTTGNVAATSGLKGIGDLFGKMARSVVTKETTIKPEYVGSGFLVLEPTYKYIILQDLSSWGAKGIVVEDGMFLACDGKVKHEVVARTNLSSALAGGEGLFNLALSGKGIVALESNIPIDELIEVELNNDVLKIDGNMAVAWSAELKFTVERSGKTLIGSAASGEGLVNVYRGTGKVLMSPVAISTSLRAATH